MKNRPSKTISLISVLRVDRDIKDGDVLLIVLLCGCKFVGHIDGILNPLADPVTQQRSHVVIHNNPDCIATSPSTLVNRILNQSIVWRDGGQAFIPLHPKVQLVSCDGNYSCEVKVLEVEKRFVVKFVNRLPVCFILHNSSIVYSEFTSFFISLHACSILILPRRAVPFFV